MLHLGRPWEGREHDLAGLRYGTGRVYPVRALLAQAGGGLASQVVDGQLVVRCHEATRHGMAHSASANKSELHNSSLPWNHATSTVCDTLERVMYLGVSTYGMRSCVIPAHAGIEVPPELDTGVRQDDVSSLHPCTWESV